MTAENLYQWSSTASNNGSVDSGINASEGQLPSTVNNGIRGAMAAVARWLGDNNATRTLSGSANTYVASALYTGSTYSTGLQLTLKANAGNTGGATLAVTNALGSALGSKQIRKFTPSGETSLAASNIIANGLYSLIYDAAASGGSGAFILQNPTRVLSDLASTTGTGSVVLANSPTLVTPVLGAATATTINGIAINSTTGTGSVVLAGSPTLVTPVLGAATATTINGVSIDSNTFSTYTPTVAATAGGFDSAVATGRWKSFGRLIHFITNVNITSIGTAAGRLLVGIPSGSVAAVGAGQAVGLNGVTGQPLMGLPFFDTATQVSVVRTADATFPGSTGQILYISGWYERAS